VRDPWEATPAGQAMSLTLARVRLLAADAYRLGQRQRGDPHREAANQLIRDALADLELGLRSVADAVRLDGQRAESFAFVGALRGARPGAPPAESAEYLDGWDAAIRYVAERFFGVDSPEVKALEMLPASRATRQPSWGSRRTSPVITSGWSRQSRAGSRGFLDGRRGIRL
jgi:hypothetical protein